MNHELMIGRHRPIIGQWLQRWVDEHTVSEKIKDDADISAVVNRLKKEILKKIESIISVEVEKVCLDPQWRKGTAIQSGSEIGKEVRVKFYGFRDVPKEETNGFGQLNR